MNEQLAAIKARRDAITPGVWRTGPSRYNVIASGKGGGKITTMDDLDALITQLQQLRGELKYVHAFAVNLELQD